MLKRLTSFLLVLTLSFSLSLPAFAVDDNNYYSLPPVGGSEPSTASLYPVNPAEFDNDDSRTLTRIYEIIQYLYLSPASWQSNSVIGFLEKIYDRLPSNLGTNFALQGGDGTNAILDGIRDWVMRTYNYLSSDNIAGNLGNIQRNTLFSADRLLSLVNAVSGINGYATENTLSSFSSAFSFIFAGDGDSPGFDSSYPFHVYWLPTDSDYGVNMNLSFRKFIAHFYRGLMTDSLYKLDGLDSQGNPYSYTGPTLYRMIKLLQETLASEDDRKLAENYKENRDQAEKDFLSGKSGKTSLGKGDFNNASQVGGALNDTFNMGGAAKVSDFLSGFGSAGSESQAWFSQTTANNLNAVEAGDGTQGVSTFSDDGENMVDVDPDPYNMASIFERYDWLEGVSMDD